MAKYKIKLSDSLKLSDNLSNFHPAGSAYKQAAKELYEGTIERSEYYPRLNEIFEEKLGETVEIARIRFWIGLFIGTVVAIISNVFVVALFKWIEPTMYNNQYIIVCIVALISLILFGAWIYYKSKYGEKI